MIFAYHKDKMKYPLNRKTAEQERNEVTLTPQQEEVSMSSTCCTKKI